MTFSRIIGMLSLAALVSAVITADRAPARPACVPDTQNQSQSQPEPTTTAEQAADRKDGTTVRLQKVKEWRIAAGQHKPGESDSAAVTIAAWPSKDLQSVIDFVAKLASQFARSAKTTLSRAQMKRLFELSDQEVQRKDLTRVLRQGVLLHTDIALLELEKGAYQQRSVWIEGRGIFADGQIFLMPQKYHWQYARQLIDSIPENQIAKGWYIATTAHMQSRRLLSYSAQNLRSALEKFPSSDRLLFYAGALHEIWASPANQNVLLPPSGKVSFGSRESELKLARQFFQKALAVNPDFAEARLHLGRVQGLLGDHAQAAAELERAAGSINDPQLSYYSSLYLGWELAQLSRLNEARDQYERAATLYPGAQSAHLAISQLAHGSGDAKAAFLAVQNVFALHVRDPWNDDPWWAYDVSHVRDAAGLMIEMRKSFGGPPR